MPIASAVIVPIEQSDSPTLASRLKELPGVEVSGIGEKGVAVVLEGTSIAGMKKLSERIAEWEEVLEFQLAYLNWEDLEEAESRSSGHRQETYNSKGSSEDE